MFWTPTIESDADELVIGAATGSADALGRHAYGIEAGWSVRARPDWGLAYSYDRWRPTLFASYSDDTDGWREGEVRTREVETGVLLAWRRVRSVRSVLASAHVSDDEYDCAPCETAVDTGVRRTSGRGGVAFSNAHQFGYSISAEEGGRWTATAEASHGRVRGTSSGEVAGSGIALATDARYYRRLVGRHDVLAIRAAAAGSWGDDAATQLFSASGSGPAAAGFGFGLDAIGLLRGFDEDAVVGTRAAVINVDYRLPLWRVGRGVGTIPALSTHGARCGVLRRRPGVVERRPLGRHPDIPGSRAFGRYGRRLRPARHVHRRRRGALRRHDRSVTARGLRAGGPRVLAQASCRCC